MKRRDFIRSAGAASLLASLGFSLQSCESDGDDDITPVTGGGGSSGGSGGGTGGGATDDVLFSFSLSDSPFDVLQTQDAWLLHPTENYLLVNVQGNIRAFTSVCTHSGCSRDWSFSSGKATCTCHGSIFKADGSVEQGPASSSLSEFTVVLDGDTVEVKK